MPIDATNSQTFANTIIKSVLDILAKQRDQKQELRIDGQFQFNPQTFQMAPLDSTLLQDVQTMSSAAARDFLAQRGQLKVHAVVGPVQFTGVFNTPPMVTFGQYPQPGNDPVSLGVANTSSPFVVIPYVHSWHQAGGQVDGFNLGLYALTAPIKGTSTHTIYWSAYGKGSRYAGRSQQQQSAWTQRYDNSSAGNFLVDSGS